MSALTNPLTVIHVNGRRVRVWTDDITPALVAAQRKAAFSADVTHRTVLRGSHWEALHWQRVSLQTSQDSLALRGVTDALIEGAP
jgi:hypothetical protein